MSAGLLSQLDTYYSWIDEAQNPIHPDEVASLIDSPVRELPIPVPANPRRGWLVAVATAVAVLVLVGGVALLLEVTGSDMPVATTPPSDGSSSSTWSRVTHDEDVFGGTGPQAMVSVTVGGPGFVAVGTDNGDAAVWSSVDGVAWSPVRHDETAFGGAAMTSVTVGGPGLVAVGDDGGNAAVWTSPDGITWSRVRHDETAFGGAAMSSVTAGGPGLVAVGDDGGNAAVWTSVDGVGWSRVPHDEEVFGGVEMSSVTAGGPGLVAVGHEVGLVFGETLDPNTGDYGDCCGRAAVAWTSPDGVGWSRVPHVESVFGGAEMRSVTAGGPGLVAVGWRVYEFEQSESHSAAVWTSADGKAWSLVPYDARVFGGTSIPVGVSEMSSVTVGGPGLVAVGSRAGDIHQSVVVWASPDGVAWSQVRHDETEFGGEGEKVMTSVIATDSTVVAVGSHSPRLFTVDAAVWVAGPDDQ